MTLALRSQLRELGIQSKETATRASEQVRGQWYSGRFLFLIDMKKRNLDIGIDDGYVTPWLVPGVSDCRDATPQRYAVPGLDALCEFGFSARLEIEPKTVEEKKVLELVCGHTDQVVQRIDPEVDFPLVMERVRQDAIQRYGVDVTSPGREPSLARSAQP
jgi:hypothetical protein